MLKPKVPYWQPKKGEAVRVCYDGKLGRCDEGEVLEVRGFAIKVVYLPWACEPGQGPVEQWFVRIRGNAFGGYLREPYIEYSFMKNALGEPGDWYSVYPMDDKLLEVDFGEDEDV
jgi:hypothetical protein